MLQLRILLRDKLTTKHFFFVHVRLNSKSRVYVGTVHYLFSCSSVNTLRERPPELQVPGVRRYSTLFVQL